MKRALGAALLPAPIVAAGIWLLLARLNLPVVGLLSGVAVGVLVVLADLGIMVGAGVGGALGARWGQRA